MKKLTTASLVFLYYPAYAAIAYLFATIWGYFFGKFSVYEGQKLLGVLIIGVFIMLAQDIVLRSILRNKHSAHIKLWHFLIIPGILTLMTILYFMFGPGSGMIFLGIIYGMRLTDILIELSLYIVIPQLPLLISLLILKLTKKNTTYKPHLYIFVPYTIICLLFILPGYIASTFYPSYIRITIKDPLNTRVFFERSEIIPEHKYSVTTPLAVCLKVNGIGNSWITAYGKENTSAAARFEQRRFQFLPQIASGDENGLTIMGMPSYHSTFKDTSPLSYDMNVSFSHTQPEGCDNTVIPEAQGM